MNVTEVVMMSLDNERRPHVRGANEFDDYAVRWVHADPAIARDHDGGTR